MPSPKVEFYINIRSLPQVYDINSGDFLMVETATGTNIIDFADVVFTLDNTNFKSLIESHTTAITDLSSAVTQLQNANLLAFE